MRLAILLAGLVFIPACATPVNMADPARCDTKYATEAVRLQADAKAGYDKRKVFMREIITAQPVDVLTYRIIEHAVDMAYELRQLPPDKFRFMYVTECRERLTHGD